MLDNRLPRWYLAIVLLVSLLGTMLPERSAHAEGSWQMGLFEGLTYRQPLYETNTGNGRSVLKVDILSPGEVINVLVCGTNNGQRIRVRLFDPFGALVYENTAVGNVDCTDPFTAPFDPAVVNAHQHVTATTGTYELHLTNFDGTRMDRFDVTVTNDVNDLIDPQENGGRLWSEYWYFWAGSFAENRSTDADLYVVSDGGYTDSYFVWKLDLNNFAGFGYGLKANSLGVRSPNAAGDVVAGLSVRTSGNQLDQQYPMYLSYPAKNFPQPIQSFAVSDYVFEDETGTDNAITSGGNGNFKFSTDFDNIGVYEIIIDVSSPSGGPPDGDFGEGDIFLRDLAYPGENVVPWDGRDNNGVLVAQGAYDAELSVRIGEFHFVADDVETSGGPTGVGLKIYRANSDGSETPTTIYWDDATVLNSTAPNAFNQTGIYDGDHNWGAFNSGGIGNVSFIDTYAFGLSAKPNPAPLAVVPDDRPLATIAKSFTPSTISVGQISNMQLEINNNNGTDPMTGVNVTDTMPFGMTLVTDPAAISVTGAGCSGFTFSPDTVVGGNKLNIIGGTIAPGSTCIVSADVTSQLPGDLVNQTSGVTSNELSFGVASNNASLIVQPGNSGTAFACDATLYEVETIGSTTRLFEIDRQAATLSRAEFSGPAYSPSGTYQYTGLAYHPFDNYLYAIVTESDGGITDPIVGSILRIDKDGKVANIGVPEIGVNNLSMPLINDRFVGGTFNAQGNYVVITDNGVTAYSGASIPAEEQALVLEIDVSNFPPQVVFSSQHGRDVADIVAHPDGNLYSHVAGQGLITIDSAFGAVAVIGGSTGFTASSLMADSFGQLFAVSDTTNQILSIDSATGVATPINTLAAGPSSDGASCTFGLGIRKEVSEAEISTQDSATYTVTVTNASINPATFNFVDDLLDNRTFVAGSLVNAYGGSVNAYDNTRVLTITGATIPAQSTGQIQFDVFFPSSTGGAISYNQAQIQAAGGPLLQSDDPGTPALFGDPTGISVLASASIGVAKSAIVAGNEVSYSITIENTSTIDLQELSLTDDLDAVFGAGNYTVTAAPLLIDDPGTVTPNFAFSGTAAGAVLIDATSGSELKAGERVVIRFTVNVDTLSDVGAGIGVYSNQVLAEASANGAIFSDLSVDGDSVDPNGDGEADEESPTVVTLTTAFTVTGNVFNDNGLAATAHDGIQGGAEAPVPGVIVELRDGVTVLDSAVTDANGRYALTIPVSASGSTLRVATLAAPGYLQVSEAYVGGGTGSVTDGAVAFTPAIGTSSQYEINFGQVKQPQWLDNNTRENSPDTVVFHPHRFSAHTSGTVAFSVSSEVSSPVNSGFNSILYIDSNCNGKLDASESAVTVPVNIDANTEICIVNKVTIPGDAANDNTYRTGLTATFNYADATGTGLTLISDLEVTDLTRVISSGEGVLVLEKTVQNLTAAGAVTTRNTAAPDDVLRYTIDFGNSGTGSVTEVLIADSTPAFSVLEAPVECPITLADSLTNCTVVMPAPADNFAGYTGPVQWQFDGPLVAGARSRVTFEIRIE